MGSFITILFYILIILGALSSMVAVFLLFTLSSVIVNLNESLSKLVEILFILGEQKKAPPDRSMERLTGMGRGLQEVPDGMPYDPRYATQAQPNVQMKWGVEDALVEKRPIGPDGKPVLGNWSENQ